MNGCEERVLPAEALPAAAQAALAEGYRFEMAYARPAAHGPEILYLINRGRGRPFLLLRIPAAHTVPSLAPIVPLLGWYEREMIELSGIQVAGHPEPYPLLIHEGRHLSAPPLGKDTEEPTWSGETAAPTMPEIEADQVQDLVWGPIRGDVLETGEFHFSYIGEAIIHYHARLGYKHRGVERRFQGLPAAAGVYLAERVSGVGSVCHALAYCQAVEAALGIDVPPRARLLRTLLAEIERLYNHFHYFALLAKTTTLKVASAEGELLEERVKQMAGRLTGSRFLRHLLCVGGVRRDIDTQGLDSLLTELGHEARTYLDRLNRTASYLDRLIATGVLASAVAFDQGATGPVARASGLDRDMRRDHPYAAYELLRFLVPVRETGDAKARADVRNESVRETLALAAQASARLAPGAICAQIPAHASGEGLGWSETPRGSLFYAVHIEEGRLARVKIKSPSFSNWRVFPFTVHGSNMMDYAINEASFGLTIAGADR
ncbi:nickel-dependent hydrogenase large subunit [Acidiferrobacter sp.]|uniref:hydrogenase large subunit n=1 Tax=Acidiferrobacter sp. TaxID=1872107 RepID=UPI002612440C|nr:nickel-dependent hydrogenase large subunit [Acidiferrobacter sp.]